MIAEGTEWFEGLKHDTEARHTEECGQMPCPDPLTLKYNNINNSHVNLHFSEFMESSW